MRLMMLETYNIYNMRKLFLLKLFMVAVALGVCAPADAQKKKKELYVPMDYSTCGYRASEKEIPDVPNVVYVTPVGGDCSERIQAAIDYVAAKKPDAAGMRGAVLLTEGTYDINTPLRITKTGVVIRGAGREKTIVRKRGADRGAMIYIEGEYMRTAADTVVIADAKVKAGATSFNLRQGKMPAVGDRITVLRPSTKEWIAKYGCNDFGGGLDYTGWKPTDIDIEWDRTVTAVEGSHITIDAPITTTLDSKYGGGMVIMAFNKGEIRECGVENLTLISEHNTWNPKDEDHCWDAVWMDNVRDCWVRRVNFRHFAGSVVNIQKHSSRITVEDCVASEPVSEIGGWRRSVFTTRGQQTLIQRCVSYNGYHDFTAGYCAAGPNAFVQCEAVEALGFSGSIGSWAAGLLFDVVDIDGNDICFKNLEQFQFGTGWNTANSMMWQCTGSTLWCYSPDEDNRSSAHGCWGTLTGNGEWTSSNDHVTPRSLFYAQLEKRLDGKGVDGHVYMRDVNATSSPTIEQAQAMAQLSLAEQRVTMEMWIDSVPYTASTDIAGAVGMDKILAKRAKTDVMKNMNNFAVTDGHLTMNGRLLTGNRFQIPWWAGRVKDNFTKKGAKPAITRFVPGREGRGWTDRIDSVVSFMADNGILALDHNYGLWYDLRRSDHERVRRADGNVEAPFYEQPFSRSGEGKAWDGLSKYDLTKPNEWYWMRLREFADKGADKGLLLFHQNYFQHNILEAGAHWVDSPWRPVNNINNTVFPEPVPFAGDKRIFIAEQFYDVTNPTMRSLHRQYIRQCLDGLKDNANAIQLISAEYTGPLHFTRFWLETIAEWQKETGQNPLVALSCTKDAQDAILADKQLADVVDIIDIRYWHYNTDGLWAPEAGKNMAPRQFMRKMKVGKTGYAEAYKAVSEYTMKFPDKAVTFFSQQYPQYGWAILMAGGSCPNVNIANEKLLVDVAKMRVMDSVDNKVYNLIGASDVGYMVYRHAGEDIKINVEKGKYRLYNVDERTGMTTVAIKQVKAESSFDIPRTQKGKIFWIEKL